MALDDLAELAAGADVVKIDVQGSEEAVVAGMGDVIAASPAMALAVEFYPDALTGFGSSADALLALYQSRFRLEVLYPGAPFPRSLKPPELARHLATNPRVAQVTLMLTRPGS